MRKYLITFSRFSYDGLLYGCATYDTTTEKKAKRKFKREFIEDNPYIIKIEIL